MASSQENNSSLGINMDNNLNSSMVWIILFSLLILLSIITNTAHLVSSLARRQFTLPQLVLALFFLLNLLDYGLLVFEFSLTEENHFPYSEHACAVYQLLHHCSALLTATALLTFSRLTMRGPEQLLQPNKTHNLRRISLALTVAVLLLLLLVPSVLFSEIAVYPSTARYCVIDLSGLASRIGLDINSQHVLTAVYFMLYKSVLSYWLPVLLIVLPLVKMMKLVNTDADKNLKISLSVAVGFSFIIFNFPLAAVTAVRQIILIRSAPMAYNTYVLDIAESLLKLLSYFYHVFRPLVCLVLAHAASIQSDAKFIINEKFQIEEKKLIPRRGDEEQ